MSQPSAFTLSPEQENDLNEMFKKLDLKAVLDGFYDVFAKDSTTAPFFEGHDTEALKKRQLNHWSNLVCESSRAKALEHSVHIGDIHERIGVTPELYLSGYAFVFEELLTQCMDNMPLFANREKRRAIIAAITKILLSDISCSLTSYIEKNRP